jgi:hypothetical protein
MMVATEQSKSPPIAILDGGSRSPNSGWFEVQAYTYGGRSGWIDLSKTTGRITIRREGFYAITGHAQYAANSAGTRRAELRKNGAAFNAGMGQVSGFSTASVFYSHIGATVDYLMPGDYISIWVNPNANGETYNQCKLTIRYLPDYAPLTVI